MSRKRTPRSKRLSVASSTRRTRGGKTSEKHGEKPIAPNAMRRFSHQHPLLNFLLIFAVLLAVFYVFITSSRSYNKRFLPLYHHLIARVSGDLLAVLGHDTTVAGASISSPRFSVQIVRGCDAIEAIALYICAVLAFPLPFLKKLPGMIIGALFLLVVNLVRIVSLFLIGVYSPEIFTLTHLDVWQALFIFFAVLLWILWLLWATRSQVVTRHASS
jgi:exosortase H (IPTLxxWG-CTERM-specific)